MKKIKIGSVSGAQGLRGEVKLFHDSGDEGALDRLTALFLRGEGEETAFRVEWHRMRKRTPIFKLEGIDSRDAAEALVGREAYTLEEESRPDAEGAWFVTDLVGLEARAYGEGGGLAAAGKVTGVIDNPAHDILKIDIGGDIRLLPFVDVFVPEARPEDGYIVISPPNGWLD